MKKNILNKKFTFLTAATLTAVSAGIVANSNTVKATELDNNTNNDQNNNVVSATKQNRVTDQDVQKAQNNVDQAQNQVSVAKKDVQTAQNNVANAQTDLQNTQAQKPTVDQNEETQNQQAVNEAQQDVNQKEQAVTDAQKQVNQANIQVAQKQTVAQNAQKQATQAQTNAQKAQQIAQSAQEIANKAQSVADQDKTVNISKLTASQSYINAVRKYNDNYINHVKQALRDQNNDELKQASKYGMSSSDFDATMSKASDESYNLKSNQYVHNEYDHNRKVNINHLTDDEQRELTDYAAGLMNNINKQIGLPEFQVNSDTQKMANDIAQGYNEDNRSLFDGKSHDYNRINQVAKDYGLNSLTSDSQYYEDAAGWIIGGGHIDGNNSDENGWYANNSNPGETNMDEIKAGIYNSLKIMYFNHEEWYHAFGMLRVADYNRNYYLDRTVTYHFAYAPSALPNSNNVTDHFIIVADDDEQANSKISNANDHSVADLDSEITRVTKDQTALKVAKLNLDKANAQEADFNVRYEIAQKALNDATKQVQNAQRLARLANTKLEQAKQDLANSKINLQNQLAIQKADQDNYTASQKKLAQYQELVAEKQNKLDNAKQNLANKQIALQNAEKNLSAKQTKLAQIKAIKSAQDLADQTAKENQKHEQNQTTETTKPVNKPDEGKSTDTTKPAVKPDEGKTTDITKQAVKPDEGKSTDTTKPAVKPDEGKTTDITKPTVKPDEGKTTNTTKPAVKPDEDKTTNTAKPAVKPDEGKTTDTTKPVVKPDEGTTTNTTKPAVKPDEGKTTDTTKPAVKPDEGKTTDTTKTVNKPNKGKSTKVNSKKPVTPVDTETVIIKKSAKMPHPEKSVQVIDNLANFTPAIDDLASSPAKEAPKLNVVQSANGRITLIDANGQPVARQFVNIHDLIQYLIRNFKGEIAINQIVTLLSNTKAYVLAGNTFSKTTITLSANGKYNITALKIENGHIYAKIAKTQFWINADLLK